MRGLHRNIGHLPPSVIMRLAKNGLLEGVELDGFGSPVSKCPTCPSVSREKDLPAKGSTGKDIRLHVRRKRSSVDLRSVPWLRQSRTCRR